MKAKIIIFIILNIFGFLLATLGDMTSSAYYNINFFWPAGVIETVGAILFGWTGVLAGTVFTVFSNMVTDSTYTSTLCYIVPSFVQSYLPFYLFKKFNCDINLRSIKSILLFSLVAAIIPQLSGGILASITLFGIGKISTINNFLWMSFLWFIDAAPWIIIFGIPIIRIFAPILKDYGFLLGQPKFNRILINENVNGNKWDVFKNSPIFFKIFLSLITVGIFPVSLFGIYELIVTKGNSINHYSPFICLGFFITLITIGLLSNAIISPIKRLSHGIEKITEGNFNY